MMVQGIYVGLNNIHFSQSIGLINRLNWQFTIMIERQNMEQANILYTIVNARKIEYFAANEEEIEYMDQ